MRYDTNNVFANSDTLRQVLSQADIELQACNDIVIAAKDAIENLNHGDLPRWLDALNRLPAVDDSNEPLQIRSDLTNRAITVTVNSKNDSVQTSFEQRTKDALSGLKPWRKGPFEIASTHVDTEWRSDQKWQRVYPHISDLSERRVLDVGCGNGYYAWRMRGAGAKLVMGIDPSVLFMLQFKAVQHFIGDQQVQLLPMTLEALPRHTQTFDSVFSMGVLYHRRDAMDHLLRLLQCLRPGGELILETLLLPGNDSNVLQPADASDNTGRYARMRNVWSIPTERALHQWLQQAGFVNIRTADISRTTSDEQRTTEWMPFESLQKAIDPDNPDLTVEGWPAPTRITVVAAKPEK